MKTKNPLFLVLSAALAVPACGSGSSDPAVACNGTELKAAEEHNYKLINSITLPPVKIAERKNLTFDWSAVSNNLLRHDIDPKKDVKMVVLLAWNIPLTNSSDETKSLQYKFIHDTIDAPDMVAVPMQYIPTDGQTSAKLYDFTLSGNPVTSAQIDTYFDRSNQHPPENYCYTVMVSSSTLVGSGAIMLQSMVLDENSSNSDVKITNDSTKLEFKADLTKLTPMGIPVGTADITLDWGDIKKNAMGDDFMNNNISTVIVGHYKESPAELSSDKFLSLDRIATELYQAEIESGTTVSFSDLKDSDGNKFEGITEDGTWIVGLQCGTCRNPSPLFVTVLRPSCADEGK